MVNMITILVITLINGYSQFRLHMIQREKTINFSVKISIQLAINFSDFLLGYIIQMELSSYGLNDPSNKGGGRKIIGKDHWMSIIDKPYPYHIEQKNQYH